MSVINLDQPYSGDNKITILVTMDNLHLLKGETRNILEEHLKQKKCPEITIARVANSNTLHIIVKTCSNETTEVVSSSLIDSTWAQMIVDQFESVDSNIIYQGQCFNDN